MLEFHRRQHDEDAVDRGGAGDEPSPVDTMAGIAFYCVLCQASSRQDYTLGSSTRVDTSAPIAPAAVSTHSGLLAGMDHAVEAEKSARASPLAVE